MGMLLSRHYADSKNNNKADGVTKEVAPKPLEKAEKKNTVSVAEIKAMTGAKLRKFAKENGVEDPEELTVGELKAVLIEKFS